MPYDRLGVLDAAFVELETPTQPMHVGFMAICEGRPFCDPEGRFRLDEIRRAIAARLDRLPRFRQHLLTVPLGQGRPIWVDDAGFDIAHHVQVTAVPAPGDESQLKATMAQLQATPLDRRQPLWELWFVEGLSGGRVAIIQKIHHALADGVSAVEVANVMFDRAITPPNLDSRPWASAPGPTPTELLGASVVEEAVRPVTWARAVAGAARAPDVVARRAGHLARAVRTWTSPAPATPLNVAIGPTRRFEVVRAQLGQLQAIKRAHGVTTNDVVLAAVAGGLRHFLTTRREPVDALRLKAMVPVSVRARAERETLGNRLSALLVDLPLDVADPVSRLRAVGTRMGQHKQAQHWVGTELALAAAEYLPAPVAARLARLVPRQRAANLLVANVPGPRSARYCLGARVDEVFPYVGPIDGMAVMVSTLRYDARLFFGLCAADDVIPDLAVLAEAIERELAILAGE